MIPLYFLKMSISSCSNSVKFVVVAKMKQKNALWYKDRKERLLCVRAQHIQN